MRVRGGFLLAAIAPVIAFAQLRVSVTGKAGEPVLDLPRSAFHVLVDGVEQPVTSFQPLDLPVSIGLVVDNGARMRDKRGQMLTALQSVVSSAESADEIFILGYNTTPYLDQPFTNDMRKLEKAFDKTEIRGWSATRDAVSQAIDYAETHAKNPTRVLFVIAGGDDGASHIKSDDLIQKAQASGVAIYCIGLLNGRDRDEKRRAEHELKALAEATGGMAAFPKESDQADDAILKFIRQIRNQYSIGYAPVPGHVAVQVNLPDLTVRVAGELTR